jgi:hypothetical protein
MNARPYIDLINQAVDACNKYLSDYGFPISVALIRQQTFASSLVGMYRAGSVRRDGKVRVGINTDSICSFANKTKEVEEVINQQIWITIWHEAGHGIIDWLKMLRRRDTQNKTGIFKGSMLREFRFLMEDEEETAEKFGEYGGDIEFSCDLDLFLSSYQEQILQASTLESKQGSYHS